MWMTVNGPDKPVFSGGATTALGPQWLHFRRRSPRLVDLRSIKLMVVIRWPKVFASNNGEAGKFWHN